MKKLLLLGAIFGLSNVANATGQLAISDLPTTENFEYTIFWNALKRGDYGTLDTWKKEKGFTFPYPTEPLKSYCNIGKNGRPSSEVGGSPNPELIEGIGSGSKKQLVFQQCDRLPLVIASNIRELRYGESVYKYFKINEKPSPRLQESLIKQKYIKEFMDALDDNQWDQLIPIILDKQEDPQIRMKAMDKFSKLYPKRMETATPMQKEYWEKAKNVNKKLGDPRNFEVVLNPINFMHDNLITQNLEVLDFLAADKKFNEQRLPLPSEDFWSGKENIDWKKYVGVKKIRDTIPELYLRLTTHRDLMLKLREMEGFDWNSQNKAGDSTFHNLFKNVVGYPNGDITDSKPAVDFISFMIKEGANPMLLNQEKQTPFMLFEMQKVRNPQFDNDGMLTNFFYQRAK